ncbi:MAG TPA: hypothetical protein VHX38_26390 [Pseudonocardiaceae bacterium]|nr:hypothetical protein [Pseudonocardiaceae bacterium]
MTALPPVLALAIAFLVIILFKTGQPIVALITIGAVVITTPVSLWLWRESTPPRITMFQVRIASIVSAIAVALVWDISGAVDQFAAGRFLLAWILTGLGSAVPIGVALAFVLPWIRDAFESEPGAFRGRIRGIDGPGVRAPAPVYLLGLLVSGAVVVLAGYVLNPRSGTFARALLTMLYLFPIQLVVLAIAMIVFKPTMGSATTHRSVAAGFRRRERESRGQYTGLRDDYVHNLKSIEDHPLQRFATPMSPARALDVALNTLRRDGVVLADVWPRLAGIVPTSVWRADQRLNWWIALSRLWVSTALGTIVTFVVTPAMPLEARLVAIGVGVIAGAWALLAGRSQVYRAYRARATAFDVHRFDLVRALHLPEPRTQSEFIRLGGRLDGNEEFEPMELNWSIAHSATHPRPDNDESLWNERRPAVTADMRAEFDKLQHSIAEQLRRIHTPEIAPVHLQRLSADVANAVLPMIRSELAKSIAKLRNELTTSIQESVKMEMTGPALVNFTGFLVIAPIDPGTGTLRTESGRILTTPGILQVTIAVIADPRARDAMSERGGSGESFFILEPIHIDGGTTSSPAPFDLVVDSATLHPTPHRHAMQVEPTDGAGQVTLALEVPDTAGLYEGWLQLFQNGRLIQAVVLTVDTLAPSKAAE